jgi:host factor-I protein
MEPREREAGVPEDQPEAVAEHEGDVVLVKEPGDPRIQEPYLNNLRKTRRNVVIYLLSGVRLTGRIASFDQHFIALQGADLQVINKDAVASIMPGPPMSAKRPGPSSGNRAPGMGAGQGHGHGHGQDRTQGGAYMSQYGQRPAPARTNTVTVTTRPSRRPRPTES